MDRQYVFGPVPSRRLGYSLGIDIIPFKTCSFDCVYCQLGKTTNKTTQLIEYGEIDTILSQIQKAIEIAPKIDFITFAGSGEPTLNKNIGTIITKIKELTNIPIAVLTNASLFHIEQVRQSIKNADLVVPSLDAGCTDVYKKINKPADLDYNNFVDGLLKFIEEFNGRLWLEVMLVRGINDSLEEVKRIAKIVENTPIERIELNTVERPPAELNAKPLSKQELENLVPLFNGKAELIHEFTSSNKYNDSDKNIKERIYELISRRPCTLDQLAASLGIHKNHAAKFTGLLSRSGLISAYEHNNSVYYKKS